MSFFGKPTTIMDEDYDLDELLKKRNCHEWPDELKQKLFYFMELGGSEVEPPPPMIEQLQELKRDFMINVIQAERNTVGKQYYDKRAKEWRTKPPVWSQEKLDAHRMKVQRLIDKIDQRVAALEIESGPLDH